MRYTLDDYERDIEGAAIDYCESVKLFHQTMKRESPVDEEGGSHPVDKRAIAVRSAHYAAAGKRLRASVALDMLNELDREYDITPTLAVKISKRLLGRGISRSVLIEEFAKGKRTAASKSEDFNKIDQMMESEAFVRASENLEYYLDKAKEIRGAVNSREKAWLKEELGG